jgi:guanyl-specific ribonuclease Sa
MKKLICLFILFSIFTGLLSGCTGMAGTPDYPDEQVIPSVTGSTPVPAVSPEASDTLNMSPSDTPDITLAPSESPSTGDLSEAAAVLKKDGIYTTKEDVGLYIHLYGKLPENFMTKQEAQKLGWKGGSLEPYAPDHCIGGSHFGNYEGLLPSKDGRTYTECDIDTLGASNRGAKRIVFSNDGLVYYTDDHYESFILLYGDEEE